MPTTKVRAARPAPPRAAPSGQASGPTGRRPAPPPAALAEAADTAEPASALIDARIADLGDWRGGMLARMRALIRAADPEVVEQWKWRGTPVWSHDGILCTGETYQRVVKLTFARGAALPDPARLFNASLEGKVRRAIDLHEGDEPDEAALQALVRAAVALNRSTRRS